MLAKADLNGDKQDCFSLRESYDSIVEVSVPNMTAQTGRGATGILVGRQ